MLFRVVSMLAQAQFGLREQATLSLSDEGLSVPAAHAILSGSASITSSTSIQSRSQPASVPRKVFPSRLRQHLRSHHVFSRMRNIPIAIRFSKPTITLMMTTTLRKIDKLLAILVNFERCRIEFTFCHCCAIFNFYVRVNVLNPA